MWFGWATALAGPTHAAIEAATWSPVTTARHDVAGDVQILSTTISGVPCWRALAAADVDPGRLLDTVLDIEGAQRWSSAGVTDAKVLSRTATQMSYYQYLSVPGWTFSADRYWFLDGVITRTDEVGKLTWTELGATSPHAELHASYAAEHTDAVEPPVNVGSWFFRRSATGSDVVYSLCTVPGGTMPQSITNMVTRRTLPDSIGDVIREARTR